MKEYFLIEFEIDEAHLTRRVLDALGEIEEAIQDAAKKVGAEVENVSISCPYPHELVAAGLGSPLKMACFEEAGGAIYDLGTTIDIGRLVACHHVHRDTDTYFIGKEETIDSIVLEMSNALQNDDFWDEEHPDFKGETGDFLMGVLKKAL